LAKEFDMRSSHLLDPDLIAAYEALPPMPIQDSLDDARALASKVVRELFKPDLTGLTLSERHVPGAPGDPEVRVLILAPDTPVAVGELRPAILETHGGGHVMGTADASLGMYAAVIRELGAVGVFVDYRLSPEVRHPGPLEDCYAALKWLVTNADELGVDPARIAVTGASAGAALAAGVALLARDRDHIPLAYLHLSQPMLDDRTCTDPDVSPYIGEYGWTRDNNRFGWESRLGVAPGSDGVSPYAAPGRMEDLSGLPPTFLNCGALDLFVEESLAFTRRLIRGGVPVELHIYPGAPHGAPLGTTGQLRQSYDLDEMRSWKRALLGARS
jgi:acetyl esterase/lipase